MLRKGIEKVRGDKERLEKIQQLKEMEVELQREILEELRKVAAVGLYFSAIELF